jgi:hypothetical protein
VSETPKIEDEQRHVADLLRSFDNVPAPDSLHQRIDSMVAEHPSRRAVRRSPLAFAGAGMAAAAVAAVVLVVALSGGGGASTVSFDQAAAPTLGAATLPAPAQSQTDPAELTIAVDGIAFPDWASQGWRSTGSRIDRVGGRSITTVFYDRRGMRIGYSILSGTPAPAASGGVLFSHGTVPYRLLTEHGAATVTWLRDGHLCVVSGRGVDGKTLANLTGLTGSGTQIS